MLLDSGSRLHGTSVPFTKTSRVPLIRAVGMLILQKPVVPFSPEASKLIAVPLNWKLDIVELQMVPTEYYEVTLKLLNMPIRG